jgi:transposase
MAAHVRVVEVPDADRRELERRVRDKGAPAREVKRARIVLLAADGVPGKQIAAMVGCAEPTVVTWRGRYAERGLIGLEDLPRQGKPAQLPEELRDRVLELTLTEPPIQYGATHWSSRLLATTMAGEGTPISHATVARIWMLVIVNFVAFAGIGLVRRAHSLWRYAKEGPDADSVGGL